MNMENYIPIVASAREFYDRHFKLQPGEGEQNRVIATNRASFNITTIPLRFKDEKERDRTVYEVAALLGIDPEAVLADMTMKGRNPSQRYTIQEDVPFQSIVRIACIRSCIRISTGKMCLSECTMKAACLPMLWDTSVR
jgi:cell division protein FtsI/penicillin-binding protein 2